VRLKKALRKAFGAIYQRKGQLLVAVATILFAVASIFAATSSSFSTWLSTLWGRICLAITGILAVIGYVLQSLEAGNIESLQRQVKESQECIDRKTVEVDVRDDTIARFRADIRELFNGQLAVLASRLEFNKKHRITVFSADGDRLVRQARFSGNPQFMDSRGRDCYPIDQGCIGKAFAEGECVATFCDPKADLQAYAQEMHDHSGIPMEVSKQFCMKSRSYAAIAIDDEDERSIAVISFECLDVSGLNVEKVRGQLRSDKVRIKKFLVQSKWFTA
jgi:hypothetical protein